MAIKAMLCSSKASVANAKAPPLPFFLYSFYKISFAKSLS